MAPVDDLSGEWGQIPVLFCSFMYAHHWQPIRVCSHLTSSQSPMPTKEKNWTTKGNCSQILFPEEISTLLALPLAGEIQSTQGKDFILTASSLTEEIKKVQSWASYRKLYGMVHNSKNLWRDEKTFGLLQFKERDLQDAEQKHFLIFGNLLKDCIKLLVTVQKGNPIRREI